MAHKTQFVYRHEDCDIEYDTNHAICCIKIPKVLSDKHLWHMKLRNLVIKSNDEISGPINVYYKNKLMLMDFYTKTEHDSGFGVTSLTVDVPREPPFMEFTLDIIGKQPFTLTEIQFELIMIPRKIRNKPQ